MYLIKINKKFVWPAIKKSGEGIAISLIAPVLNFMVLFDMLAGKKEFNYNEFNDDFLDKLMTIAFTPLSAAWVAGWYIGELPFLILGRYLDNYPRVFDHLNNPVLGRRAEDNRNGLLPGQLRLEDDSWRVKPYAENDKWTKFLYRLGRLPTLFVFQIPLMAIAFAWTLVVAASAIPVALSFVATISVIGNVIGIIGTAIEYSAKLGNGMVRFFKNLAGYPEPQPLNVRVALHIENVLFPLVDPHPAQHQEEQQQEEEKVPAQPVPPGEKLKAPQTQVSTMQLARVQRRLGLLNAPKQTDEQIDFPEMKALRDNAGNLLENPHILPCNHEFSKPTLDLLVVAGDQQEGRETVCHCPECNKPFTLKQAIKDYSLETVANEYRLWTQKKLEVKVEEVQDEKKLEISTASGADDEFKVHYAQ